MLGLTSRIEERADQPSWARWNADPERRYTIGVEEEVMLLEPSGLSLAQSSDDVLATLSGELSVHVSPETHAAVVELATGIHATIDAAATELRTLRGQLVDQLSAMGLAVAAAGTHPLIAREGTRVSGAARYRGLNDSLRSLARREPTMALHVHIGVPDREDAIRLLNALRYTVPVLIALAANSPFLHGRDAGFASIRTVIFEAFPRTGMPRMFNGYADYIEAVGSLIRAGAVPDPTFFWWDLRPQPSLGTVEIRAMDSQSSVSDVAPLVALIQSLAHLALEEGPPVPPVGPEVLAENRFLAARDGMDARLIQPATGRTTPVRHTLDALLARCLPHALALGCANQLQHVRSLASSNGADRQRAYAAANAGLGHLVSDLAGQFVTPEQRLVAQGA